VLTLACRGCCCGTSKHPDVDHDDHLRRLRAACPDLEITGCLGPCRWSNVVVAIDEQGTQHWFAKVLSDSDLAAVLGWLADPSGPCPAHLERIPLKPDHERAAHIGALRRSGLSLAPAWESG
jgi:hypothetical protein